VSGTSVTVTEVAPVGIAVLAPNVPIPFSVVPGFCGSENVHAFCGVHQLAGGVCAGATDTAISNVAGK
jgi:hypothetical protein